MSQNIDWDHIRKYARANVNIPPEWPKNVAPISMQGLTLLGMDAKHRLYWDGEPVEVKQPLVLNWWQRLLAFGTAACAFLVAWITYAEYARRVGGWFALFAVCGG